MKEIIDFLDRYLTRNHLTQIGAVEANALLSKAGLLRDSEWRPGAPLRDLLRKGKIPHAYQLGSTWVIPKSNGKTSIEKRLVKPERTRTLAAESGTERARGKYKPRKIKYLLIAEAPPKAFDRFFYFESVNKHDDLFLGVMGVLYPKLKATYIDRGRPSDQKRSMLRQFMNDGFFLLDLSEVPISNRNGLADCIDSLIERMNKLVDSNTRVILIKTNVFDLTYPIIHRQLGNRVANVRMPFPGSGQQKEFARKFVQALSEAGYGK